MHRRTLLRAAAAALLLRPIRRMGALDIGGSAAQDEELLFLARTRIDQHRKAAGVVVVRGPSGEPIVGAKVLMEQTAHEFLFGSNLARFGRIADVEREAAYRARFAEVFNYATLGFYWRTLEADRGRPDYTVLDEAAGWCARHGIICRGHPLAWDDPISVPGWLPEDVRLTESLSLARVRECVTRFRDQVQFWDVVNEPGSIPRHDNQMSRLIRHLGAPEFIRRHLLAARAANPAATLIVNDWQTERTYFNLLDSLRQSGSRLFDAVGIQSHMHSGLWPLRQVWQVVDVYAALGVPIHFPEITVVSGLRTGGIWGPSTPASEKVQADYVAQLYTALFGHPAVAAASWWDFTDDHAWRDAPSGWLRRDMSPKPVYERLRHMIRNEWWTRVSGRTNLRGEFAIRAFRGAHRIRITAPSGQTRDVDVRWVAGSTNRVIATMS